MDGPPHVSIIVPVHDGEDYLPRTLASIEAQTYRQWSATVVDDGSTDGSREVAAGFVTRDPRFCVAHQTNRGQSAARNRGVELSESAWLLFLDADDELLPNHVEELVNAANSIEQCALAHSGGRRVFTDGRCGRPEFPPTPPHFHSLAARNAFFIHMCLVRRDVFEAAGRFDESLSYCEDWDLWQRIARLDLPVGVSQHATALYHLVPRSLSHDVVPMIEAGLRVIRRGHAADERVAEAAAWARDGADPSGAPWPLFFYPFWALSVAVGAGTYEPPFGRHIVAIPDELPCAYLTSTYRAGVAWALGHDPDTLTRDQLINPLFERLLADLVAHGLAAATAAEFVADLERLADSPAGST